jgi:hypothetical protein
MRRREGGTAVLLPLPACGERVGVRGPVDRFRLAPQAQARGEAPSPGAQERADLSPQAGRCTGRPRAIALLTRGRGADEVIE